MKRIVSALTPFVLLVALVAATLWHPERLRFWTEETLFLHLPYLIGGLVVFMGWRFQQTAYTFLALVVGLAVLAMDLTATREALPLAPHLLRNSILVLLPLNFVFFPLLPERGLLTPRGLLRLVPIVLQAGLVVGLASQCDRAGLVCPSWLTPSHADLPASLAALALLAIASTVLILRRRRLSVPSAPLLMASILSMFFALSATARWWPEDLDRFVLLAFSSLTMILFVAAIMESSWRGTFTDALTGLPGKRALELRLPRLGGRYAIVMADLDHFKRINDTHGHDTGDQVLRFVASRLSKLPMGQAYRFGGEEFAILIPRSDVAAAKPWLDTLRKEIADTPFILRSRHRPKRGRHKEALRAAKKEGRRIRVTVSFGVAERTETRRRPMEVLEAADKALYRAKRSGRNKVVAG